jgi:hypothetical protein
MKQLEVGWKAFYQTEISQDVRYIVLPKGKEWVCALARNEPLTLAKWKELFRRVDLDEEEMNADLNVVQEAGVMIDNRLRVCEVRTLAEELQYQPGKRAACTLTACTLAVQLGALGQSMTGWAWSTCNIHLL